MAPRQRRTAQQGGEKAAANPARADASEQQMQVNEAQQR